MYRDGPVLSAPFILHDIDDTIFSACPAAAPRIVRDAPLSPASLALFPQRFEPGVRAA